MDCIIVIRKAYNVQSQALICHHLKTFNLREITKTIQLTHCKLTHCKYLWVPKYCLIAYQKIVKNK